jgi:hypothetical protein
MTSSGVKPMFTGDTRYWLTSIRRYVFTGTFLGLAAVALASCIGSKARSQQIYPTPAPNDETGFVSIFNGKTLDGWEGDPKYWRVENGYLVGEVTPETLLKRNTFIIWWHDT